MIAVADDAFAGTLIEMSVYHFTEFQLKLFGRTSPVVH
jgi:hypothetical protein